MVRGKGRQEGSSLVVLAMHDVCLQNASPQSRVVFTNSDFGIQPTRNPSQWPPRWM